MILDQLYDQFIHSPYPLWEIEFTNALACHKWSQLGLSPDAYSTTNVWHKKQLTAANGEPIISIKGHQILIEQTDHDYLRSFYQENDLEAAVTNEIAHSN